MTVRERGDIRKRDHVVTLFISPFSLTVKAKQTGGKAWEGKAWVRALILVSEYFGTGGNQVRQEKGQWGNQGEGQGKG